MTSSVKSISTVTWCSSSPKNVGCSLESVAFGRVVSKRNSSVRDARLRLSPSSVHTSAGTLTVSVPSESGASSKSTALPSRAVSLATCTPLSSRSAPSRPYTSSEKLDVTRMGA